MALNRFEHIIFTKFKLGHLLAITGVSARCRPMLMCGTFFYAFDKKMTITNRRDVRFI